MWVESSHADLRETGIGGKMRKIGVKLGTLNTIVVYGFLFVYN